MTLVTTDTTKREQQHRRVQPDLGLVRNRVEWHERKDRLQPGSGQYRAQDPGGERNQQAFDQQLTEETRAAGPECCPNRHFLLAGDRLRQHQVRDVGARNQEQQADGAEHDPQVLSDAAWEGLFEGQQADTPVVREHGGLALLQVRDNRPEISRRVCLADIRLQPSEQVHVSHALDDLTTAQDDRKIDISASPHEAFRHDADDGAELTVQPEAAADDRAVAAELTLPESITKHGDWRRTRGDIVRPKGPSDERRHAHDLERIRRAVIASEPLRLGAVGPQDVADRGGDDTVENAGTLCDLEKLIGGVTCAPARLAGH